MLKYTSKSTAISPSMVRPVTTNNRIECTAIKSFKSLNFLSSSKLNYYFLRAFGLWPFSFVRDSNSKIKKPKVTKIDLLWFIISMPLYILASIVFYNNWQALQMKTTDLKVLSIINNGDSMRIALSLIFISLSIAIDMFNRFKLVNVLNNFVQFDVAVSIPITGWIQAVYFRIRHIYCFSRFFNSRCLHLDSASIAIMGVHRYFAYHN